MIRWRDVAPISRAKYFKLLATRQRVPKVTLLTRDYAECRKRISNPRGFSPRACIAADGAIPAARGKARRAENSRHVQVVEKDWMQHKLHPKLHRRITPASRLFSLGMFASQTRADTKIFNSSTSVRKSLINKCHFHCNYKSNVRITPKCCKSGGQNQSYILVTRHNRLE